MAIHVRIWTGSGTARVTDMTDAGKRGKKCRVLRIAGAPLAWGTMGAVSEQQQLAGSRTWHLLYELERVSLAESFDTVRECVRDMIATARADGVPMDYLTSYDEEIRAIDAPREPLTAGVPGVWSASADEEGIHLHALNDPNNEWTEITHPDQTHARAYDIARKVWPRVQAAQDLYDASKILAAAGARLHGYCAMD